MVCTRFSHYQQPTTNNQQPLLSSHYGSHSTGTMTEISQQHTSFHPTMVLAQKSRPSSTVPEHGPVLRKGEKRRERERVREKRERKWGLTGSWRLYPIFAVALLGISPLPTIFALLLFTTHHSPHTTHNRSYHPTMVLAQPVGKLPFVADIESFHPTMVLAQL